MSIPDTSGYMNLGFALFFIVTGIYVASIYIRSRNLRRDLEMLESLEKDNKSTP